MLLHTRLRLISLFCLDDFCHKARLLLLLPLKSPCLPDSPSVRQTFCPEIASDEQLMPVSPSLVSLCNAFH